MISVTLSRQAWEEGGEVKDTKNINAEGDSVLRLISWGNHPSSPQIVLDLAIFIFGPFLLQFIFALLPLQPPVPGIINNWMFLFIYAPGVTCSIGIANLISMGRIVGEPTRWAAIPILGVLTVISLSLLCQFAKPFPLILVNAIIPAFLLGATFLVTVYLSSPNRFTAPFNIRVKAMMDFQRNTNGFFFVAILYLVAFLKTPYTEIKFILTLLFHSLAWAMENVCATLQRKHTETYEHFNTIVWFQLMTEVFATLTFPVISDLYFFSALAFRLVLLVRFPLLLTDKFWELATVATDVASTGNEATFKIRGFPQFRITKPLARVLWYFIPTAYTKHEYHHRILLSFFYALYAYIWTPSFYIAMSLFLRHGYNKQYYSFHKISTIQYNQTLIYSGVSIFVFAVAFTFLTFFIRWQTNYSPLSHGLYKIHQFPVYLILSIHNAITFTMCLLLQHLHFLYDINSW